MMTEVSQILRIIPFVLWRFTYTFLINIWLTRLLLQLVQSEPVRDEGRGCRSLDLDAQGVHLQDRSLALWHGAFQNELASDPGACAHGGKEADLVEPVVDRRALPLNRVHHLIGKRTGHGEREVAMRDRAAKGGFSGGARGVEVDELVVLGDIGEGVDARLGHGDPARRGQGRADVRGQVFASLYQGAHGA